MGFKISMAKNPMTKPQQNLKKCYNSNLIVITGIFEWMKNCLDEWFSYYHPEKSSKTQLRQQRARHAFLHKIAYFTGLIVYGPYIRTPNFIWSYIVGKW